MKKVKFFTLGLAVFALAALFTSCQKEKDGPGDPNLELRTASTPVSDGGVVPEIIPGKNRGGNRTCQEVTTAFGNDCTFANSSPNYNDDNRFEGTVGPISWTTVDGKYLSWESGVPVRAAFIMKGANSANVYVYGCNGEPCASYDSGLAAPPNASGEPAGLSNLTICWETCGEVNEDCISETAWGGATEGAGNGWWYYFNTSGDAVQPIYAGQNLMVGGQVEYDQDNGKLIITLGPNWDLQSGSETVKIQGYEVIPTKRPAAGQFTYKGNLLIVPVTHANFFAIHLDVEYCE
jgi:hypothetical protein